MCEEFQQALNFFIAMLDCKTTPNYTHKVCSPDSGGENEIGMQALDVEM